MQVILRKDVDNLGFEFEVVSVKPGYARNFLIPKGFAVLATPKAQEELNKTLEERREVEAKLISEAESKNKSLEGLEVKLEAKVGTGEKLYGSVNNADLAKALNNAGVEIDKKNIKIIGNTIKTIGKHSAQIRFHREVQTSFDFEVIPDKESIKRAEDAAKAKVALAKLDAEKAAKKAEEGESSFEFDNPLFEKKEETKEEVVAEVAPVAEAQEAQQEEETPKAAE